MKFKPDPAQQLGGLLDQGRVIALDVLFADVQQPHGRLGAILVIEPMRLKRRP